MCWSAKVKTPKVNTQAMRAVDPAPLTEEPKAVEFGTDDDNASGLSTEVATSGKKSVTVEKVPKTSQQSRAKKTSVRGKL